ncbi:MAG: DUF5050 domain-containing protein [Bacillota bacterium]|nr:DUF5050 domain-containing protein [Bacillota bacterium]
MKEGWYYYKDGTQHGPFTWEQLWQESKSGKLNSTDQVWNQELDNWVEAGQIPGLTNIPDFVKSAPPPPAQLVKSVSVQKPEKQVTEKKTEATGPAPAKSGGKLIPIIIIAVLAVVLLSGAGIYYFLLRDTGVPAVGPDEEVVDIGPVIEEEILPPTVEEISVEEELGLNFPMGSGNAPGNISNGGIAAVEGNWVYFRSNQGGALTRSNMLTGETTLITSDSAWFINVLNDWIFYVNRDDQNHLYRIRTDGSDRSVVIADSVWFLNLVDGWLYYVNEDDAYNLYRIDTAGNNEQRLNTDYSWFLNVVDGWIYYINQSDRDTIYRISLDGSDKEQVNDVFTSGITVTEDGWIYYINEADRSRLARVRVDGTGDRMLTDHPAWFANASSGWVYYSNEADNFALYRIEADGSSSEKITADSARYNAVIGDWIYYLDFDEEDTIYKIKTDGTGRRYAEDEF